MGKLLHIREVVRIKDGALAGMEVVLRYRIDDTVLHLMPAQGSIITSIEGHKHKIIEREIDNTK